MNRGAGFLHDVQLRLDQMTLDAQAVRSSCHDRIAIADVEAQLAATRQRLENRRSSGHCDKMGELALERALGRLAHALTQAKMAA